MENFGEFKMIFATFYRHLENLSTPCQIKLHLKKDWEGDAFFDNSIQLFFIFCIFAIIDDTLVMNFGKNLQSDFPKMRGWGGQRPFGTFPKIHPFWICHASLITEEKEESVALDYLQKHLFLLQISSSSHQIQKMSLIIPKHSLLLLSSRSREGGGRRSNHCC